MDGRLAGSIARSALPGISDAGTCRPSVFSSWERPDGSEYTWSDMPPDCRNQRPVTTGDTPVAAAASSVDEPSAIERQGIRAATRGKPGRPGDRVDRLPIRPGRHLCPNSGKETARSPRPRGRSPYHRRDRGVLHPRHGEPVRNPRGMQGVDGEGRPRPRLERRLQQIRAIGRTGATGDLPHRRPTLMMESERATQREPAPRTVAL